MTLSVGEVKEGDAKIQYLATPVVTPAWAVANGRLYFGLYPQVVAGALHAAAAKDQSILNNEKFMAMKKQFAVGNPTAVTFVDLPATRRRRIRGCCVNA